MISNDSIMDENIFSGREDYVQSSFCGPAWGSQTSALEQVTKKSFSYKIQIVTIIELSMCWQITNIYWMAKVEQISATIVHSVLYRHLNIFRICSLGQYESRITIFLCRLTLSRWRFLEISFGPVYVKYFILEIIFTQKKSAVKLVLSAH